MKPALTLKQRLLSLSVYLIALVAVSRLVTGVWIPTEGGESIWFFSAIGLLFFTHLSSPFFVTPRDSLANCAAAALMLATVDLRPVTYLRTELNLFRWLSFSIAAFTSASAIIAITLYNTDVLARPHLASLSRIAYKLSDSLGRGPVVFSPPVLISIVGFHQDALIQQLWLLFLWSFLVFAEPVDLAINIVASLRGLRSTVAQPEATGEIQRIDDPNLIRVRLQTTDTWTQDRVHVAQLPDSRQVEVLPLFVQIQNAESIGTGLCHQKASTTIPDAPPGHVYCPPAARAAHALLAELSGSDIPVDLIGFVVENSRISRLCFEVSSQARLEEGSLVFTRQRDQHVYYQILDAQTKEETFSQNPRGTHVVFAEQLGTLDPDKGFVKYGWVPSMNSPVFRPRAQVCPPQATEPQLEHFELGCVPNSGIPVRLDFDDTIEHHTAILGVTGTGKTELAFDIVRYALSRGIKVFCVDFTGEYLARLHDLAPENLGLQKVEEEDLQQHLFDVETGKFSAAEEKRALQDFIDAIKPGIAAQVDDFLQPEGARLGVFQLEEIANTKATLRATELYLSTIFQWARTHRGKHRILLVLEEAHTIVPEMNLYGYDRVETSAVVGRMSQIALQGRKYQVGLLLISQRTALVSKTLLSQCHTVLCFAMHDQTGLDYLSTVFSTDYVRVIPNLRFLQGIAFGKGVLSDRPIIFQIPEKPSKREASKALAVPQPLDQNNHSPPSDW